MSVGDHDFCRILLAQVRSELGKSALVGLFAGQTYAEAQLAPRNLTALRSFRDHWVVQGDDGFCREVEACCAFAARAAALSDWLEEMSRRAEEQKRRRIIDAVERTFSAWKRAQARVSRCRRPESLEAARAEEREAERAYREASGRRDELVRQEQGQ